MTKKGYLYSQVKNDSGAGIRAEAERILLKIGAKDFFIGVDPPQLFFSLNGKPFKIAIGLDYFLKHNGGRRDYACRQAWSATRDYLKGLCVLAALAPEGEEWTAMPQHLFLNDGSTMADYIARKADKMPLALPGPGGTQGSE